MSDTGKVKRTHTQRAAVIYIRQSSPTQVVNNRESTERQYALVKRAGSQGKMLGTSPSTPGTPSA